MSARTHCRHCRPLSARAKFYKSLRGFLITIGILFFAGVFVDNDFFEIFRLVAFWWGIFLGVRYIRFNGIPSTKGWLSDDWFDWIQARYPAEVDGEETPPRAAGEEYDPLWKDKDLV